MDHELIHFLWVWVGRVLLLFLCPWAIFWSTNYLRWAWVAIAGCWFVTPMVQHYEDGFQAGIFSVDLTMFLVLFWISHRSREPWALLAAACGLITVMGDILQAGQFGVTRYVLVTANGFFGGYALIGALLWGLLESRSKCGLDETDGKTA